MCGHSLIFYTDFAICVLVCKLQTPMLRLEKLQPCATLHARGMREVGAYPWPWADSHLLCESSVLRNTNTAFSRRHGRCMKYYDWLAVELEHCFKSATTSHGSTPRLGDTDRLPVRRTGTPRRCTGDSTTRQTETIRQTERHALAAASVAAIARQQSKATTDNETDGQPLAAAAVAA